MNIQLAKIKADRSAESRDAEMQQEVETKRAEMELARRRATDVVHAKIEREASQERADAKFYTESKGAEGQLYREQKDAEAAFYRTQKDAEAACKFPLPQPSTSLPTSLPHLTLATSVA